MSDIHFIITGGTIDKSYNPVTEKPELDEGSFIQEYIRSKIRPCLEPSFETLCMIG